MMEFTVVWRPGSQGEFRGDHVTAEVEEQEAIVSEAKVKYYIDLIGAGTTHEDAEALLKESYDLCAILRGHCSFFY